MFICLSYLDVTQETQEAPTHYKDTENCVKRALKSIVSVSICSMVLCFGDCAACVFGVYVQRYE